MEKKLTNSGPLREPADKHSIYDREIASHLLLSKAISPQEHETWRRYHLLPDGVSVSGDSAGRVQPEADRAMQVSQALASLNAWLLFLQHWLRQRLG
jgi:hypothetical protein